jgi:hypothetical protein
MLHVLRQRLYRFAEVIEVQHDCVHELSGANDHTRPDRASPKAGLDTFDCWPRDEAIHIAIISYHPDGMFLLLQSLTIGGCLPRPYHILFFCKGSQSFPRRVEWDYAERSHAGFETQKFFVFVFVFFSDPVT